MFCTRAWMKSRLHPLYMHTTLRLYIVQHKTRSDVDIVDHKVMANPAIKEPDILLKSYKPLYTDGTYIRQRRAFSLSLSPRNPSDIPFHFGCVTFPRLLTVITPSPKCQPMRMRCCTDVILAPRIKSYFYQHRSTSFVRAQRLEILAFYSDTLMSGSR